MIITEFFILFTRLRELLLDTIKGPIVVADDELKECKEQLEYFSDDPFQIHLALQQCLEFQVLSTKFVFRSLHAVLKIMLSFHCIS